MTIRAHDGVERGVLRAPIVSIVLTLASSAIAQPAIPPAAQRAAQRATQPATDALPTFAESDLRLLDTMLEQGAVALVELEEGERLPAIVLATRVEADAAEVAAIVANPEGYPSFMPAVSEVAITERNGASLGFHWTWRTAVFQLRGDAALTHLAPTEAQRARGHRIVLTRIGGDLGRGREVWRIVPIGERRSLIVLSTRMDLRDANYLARTVSQASRSINRSVNLAMGFAAMLRAKHEAERRAGVQPVQAAEQELRPPRFRVRELEPLLHRGDLLLIESDGAVMRRGAVLSRLPHGEREVRQIMLDPVAFCQALIQGSHAEVREVRPDGRHFDWRVDIPIVGSGGAMRLHERTDRVIELEATSGALAGGQWRFNTYAMGPSATVVYGWARFDVAGANFLLRAICDADAAFRPGLSAATEIMMARALRIRLRF